MTITITEFLLARFDDDEAIAEQVRPHEYLTDRDDSDLRVGDAGGYAAVAYRSGRVLAECEAKRRIVNEVLPRTPRKAATDQILRLLALPYAGHPDYDQAWAL